MIDRLNSEELDFVVRVSWLYYSQGMTQVAIAEHLGIARSRVLRALAVAQETGLVQFHLNHPLFNCLSIERELKDTFQLRDAMVVPTPPDPRLVREAVGQAGALYLQKTLSSGDVLGCAWGNTVNAAVQNLQPRRLKNFSVVMALGGLTTVTAGMNPIDMVRTIASKTEGQCYYLPVPAIVDSKAVRDVLLTDQGIRTAFSIARSANKLLVGIGDTTDHAAVIDMGFLNPAKMAELRGKGAVGDILARYFDKDGRPVKSDLEDRIVGLSLEDVRQVPTVIAVAGGPSKVAPILGALRGRYVDVLITDETTAQQLLARGASRD